MYRRTTSLFMASLVVWGLTSAVFSSPTSAAIRPGQVITVEATSSLATVAVVRAWEWSKNHYVPVFAPTLANVGIHGVGPTREGMGRTPVGGVMRESCVRHHEVRARLTSLVDS
jgi:hypothetical protein